MDILLLELTLLRETTKGLLRTAISVTYSKKSFAKTMRLRMQRTNDTKNEETAVRVPTKYVPCRPNRKSPDSVQGRKMCVCMGGGGYVE